MATASGGPVQIVWSYDTTGSMSTCLMTVKSQVCELSERLFKDIPNLEIGLIAHGDYCDEATTYLVKMMAFSSNPAEIADWTRDVGSTSGGDAPEAYEISLRAAARDFAWKPNARKVFVLIGDEVPHKPDYPMNRDSVNWEEQLAALAELGVRCFGVQCLGNLHAEFFYKALAERTDGLWLPLSDLRVIPEVFTAVCLQISNVTAFDQFKAQMQQDGPVANALVPIMIRLAKRRRMSGEELAQLSGLVATLAVEHGKPPENISLPVEAVQVSALCGAGGCCEVELLQHFVNRGTEGAKSFEYRFAMPPGAAVFHFEAVLSSGRRIRGLCKGKEAARQQYRQALARGDKAFLVEENDADLFAMQLGNLLSEERVQIVLRYLVELEEVSGAYRLRLPQHVAPRPGARATSGHMACYPITVMVEAEEASGAVALRALSHRSRWEQLPATEAAAVRGRLSLLPEHGTLNDDLLFEVQVAAAFPALSVAVERCETLKSTAVRVCMRPPVALPPAHPQAKHMALLVDASASMQGALFAAAQEAAKAVLTSLAEGVQCSCSFFRNAPQPICSAASPTEAACLLEAAMGTAVCGGGSNFLAAFEAVAGSSPRVDAVVLISDGQGPEKPQEIFKKAKDLNVPLFCLGIGPDPGAELLQGLAFVSKGMCELASTSELLAAAQRLAADVMAEAVDFHITLSDGVPAPQSWPTVFRAYPGRRAVSYFHFQGDLPSDAKLSVNGLQVDLQNSVTGQRLHRLGAKLRIQELERTAKEGFEELVKTLADQHGLTSSQTSFVAVEERTDGQQEELPSESQPAFAPRPSMDLDSDDEDMAPTRGPTRGGSSWSDERGMATRGSSTVRGPAVTRGGDERGTATRGSGATRGPAATRGGDEMMATRGMATRGAGAVRGPAAARTRGGGGSDGSHKGSASSLPGTAPAALLPRVLLPFPFGSDFYQGEIQHDRFGPGKELALLMIQKKVATMRYEGLLAVSKSRTELVAVTIEITSASCLRITAVDRSITLEVEVKEAGLLHGTEGTFQLSPRSGRMEFENSHGDDLVLLRLPKGVALYTNGALTVPQLEEVKMHRLTGGCDAGKETFVLPEETRERYISEIEVFLSDSSTSLTFLG